VSHVTCENCQNSGATCRRCGGIWSKNGLRGKGHHCPGRFRATPKTFRVPCGGRHGDFQCDRCSTVAEGAGLDRGYSYPKLPTGWSSATPPGSHLSSLDLCASCAARNAVAFDAAMGNGDASKLDEAINRVESIACGWAFDLGMKWSRTAVSDFAGGFQVPPNLRQAVIDLIRSDGATAARASFNVPLTPSQQIKQEDGEYSREEYR
jgi:hypothetical protein